MLPLLHRIGPFIALATLACAGNSNAPPPGSGSGPLSTWDVVEADTGARMIYVHNNTQQPITIQSVTIIRCENLRQNCGDHPANLLVPPGKTVAAFRLQRLNSRLAWSWEYRIHTAPQQIAVTTGPTVAVVTGLGGTRSVAYPISVDSFRAAVPAITTGASCGRMTVADLPAGHQALLIVFGTPSQPAARRVMVRYDASGSAYDYSDNRVGPPGDSTTTMITLDMVRQTGLLRNSRGSAPPQWFRVTGAGLASAESLDHPGEMVTRVKRECGGA